MSSLVIKSSIYLNFDVYKGQSSLFEPTTVGKKLFSNCNCQALDELETDSSVGAVIITGRGRAFAAGADIKEMLPLEYAQCASGNFLAHWTRVAENRKVLWKKFRLSRFLIESHDLILKSEKTVEKFLGHIDDFEIQIYSVL